MKPKDKDLRARGYMTTDEFVDLLTPGLKDYMKQNWAFAGEDSLHHPGDLASTASIYTDMLYNYVETFGVQPVKEKDN